MESRWFAVVDAAAPVCIPVATVDVAAALQLCRAAMVLSEELESLLKGRQLDVEDLRETHWPAVALVGNIELFARIGCC